MKEMHQLVCWQISVVDNRTDRNIIFMNLELCFKFRG